MLQWCITPLEMLGKLISGFNEASEKPHLIMSFVVRHVFCKNQRATCIRKLDIKGTRAPREYLAWFH